MCGAFLRRSLVFIECNVKMATHQMIESDSPSRNKKAKIESFEDSKMSIMRDIHVKLHMNHSNNIVFKEFEVTSSSDGEIINGDSGFQEIANTADVDVKDVAVDEGNAHETDSHTGNNNVTQDDMDDNESIVSDLSCGTCISDMSADEWKPISGPIAWVHHQMCSGTDPRDILADMIPDNTLIPAHLDSITLWRIILNMLSEPPRRKKLPNINTLDDVVKLIHRCNKIILLTGAGVSVSCGIPDFRSRDGIYARLSKDFPDLPDPQAMFDIHYFRKDPRPFFKFAKEIYPGQFEPSISHKFIKLLEDQNKLLRNYTQNIDTLEQATGIKRVITCHGSFATATCTSCKHKVGASFIKNDIFEQKIPKCPQCPPDCEEMAVMKPDIVFFGEGLSDEFHSAMTNDKDECDLLIVMGSSLKVRPVALIPSSIPEDVPQILINREPLNHLTFDVELLGDCDVIVQHLCNKLGGDWKSICSEMNPIEEIVNFPKVEVKQEADSFVEVNNNTARKVLPLPFTFNATISEPRASDNGMHHNISSPLKDHKNACINESTQNLQQTDFIHEEAESSQDDRISSNFPENKYLYIQPNKYIFKGAEVCDSDLKTSANNQDDSDDDSRSISSLSGPSSFLSSSPSPSSSNTSPSFTRTQSDNSSKHENLSLNSNESNVDTNKRSSDSPTPNNTCSEDSPPNT